MPRFQDYVFTDISSEPFEAARSNLGPWGSNVTFSTLNIEEDPTIQGYELGQFDLVFFAKCFTSNYAKYPGAEEYSQATETWR